MTTLLKWLLLVPVALVVIMLAVANRAPVTIVVDPFPPPSENLTFAAPLFLVVLVSVIVGVLIGGAGAWLRQGSNRRAARQAQAEANRPAIARWRDAGAVSRPALGFRSHGGRRPWLAGQKRTLLKFRAARR